MANKAWFKLLTILVLAGSVLVILFVSNKYAIAGAFVAIALYMILLFFASRGVGKDENKNGV